MLGSLSRLLVALVLLALAAEAAARLAYRVAERRPMDRTEIDARKRQLVAEARALEVRPERRARGTIFALHPYLGLVYDPAYAPDEQHRLHGVPVSPFGFLDDKSPLVPAARDQVVVGVFGGSMAWWLSKQAGETLAREMERIPELRGKRIVLVRTALGAVKQPQQLMALAWLLSLGGHFDLIVNLDGFNEVALPATSHVKQGVFPFYPHEWSLMVGQLDDPMVTRLAGEITALTRLRGLWAELFLAPGLRSTGITTLLWRAVDGVIGRLTAARRLELAVYEGEIEPAERSFAAQGPDRRYASDDEMYEDLVRVWRESSLQMHRLARQNGVRYYHFLQPNQYFPGSKPIGEAERKVAIRDGSEYGASVRRAYPLMRDGGAELVREGVRFRDLTGAFQGIEEPLYVDDCCHVSERGSAILARRIAEAIAEDFAASRAAASRAAAESAAASRSTVESPTAEHAPEDAAPAPSSAEVP